MEINLTKYIKILEVFTQFDRASIVVHFKVEMSNVDKDANLKMFVTELSIMGIKVKMICISNSDNMELWSMHMINYCFEN